jgi:pimeloyl-ACP methyl ester carboxylesterase
MSQAQTQPSIGEKVVEVWNGELAIRFQVAGSGPPLVYLHPAMGMGPLDPFLIDLAERYTIYAPEIPGTTPGDPHSIHKVDSLWDLVLIYEEAIRGLGLAEPPLLIGQSFGGMVAAELAAHFPGIGSKLILLAPLGLWREDAPVTDFMSARPEQLPAILFADPAGPAAVATFTMPPDPEMAIAIQSGMVWAMGCTGKFLWPIPDRGLRKRLHRITMPTLIVWGEKDNLVPSVYAEEFGDAIADSTVAIVPGSGHIPQVEATAATLALVGDFLA